MGLTTGAAPLKEVLLYITSLAPLEFSGGDSLRHRYEWQRGI